MSKCNCTELLVVVSVVEKKVESANESLRKLIKQVTCHQSGNSKCWINLSYHTRFSNIQCTILISKSINKPTRLQNNLTPTVV